jgi:hypothetical protein
MLAEISGIVSAATHAAIKDDSAGAEAALSAWGLQAVARRKGEIDRSRLARQ